MLTDYVSLSFDTGLRVALDLTDFLMRKLESARFLMLELKSVSQSATIYYAKIYS